MAHCFEARWAAVCRGCTMPIQVGDRIRHDPSGTAGAFVHGICPVPQQILAGGVTVEAIRARVQVDGSDPAVILIPSGSAITAATIAARAVMAAPPIAKVAPVQRIRASGRGGRADRAAADPRLPPAGSALQGRFKGQTFRAQLLADGHVAMGGVQYATLSAAAKVARGGIPTSGFVFFGLTG